GRRREGGGDAVERGAGQRAGALGAGALAEPPPASGRVALLLELGGAEELAGQNAAIAHLAEARELTRDRRRRAEIALQIARAEADLFHWVEAVDVSESALAELGDPEPDLQARLEAEVA